VETFGEKSIRRGRMFQVIVSDGSGLLTLNWFNGVRYVKRLFKVGEKLAINGKVEWYNGFSMTHPEFEKLEKDEDPIQTGKVIPIYPLTQELKSAGLDQRNFRKMLKRVLESGIEIPEIMPKSILSSNDLIELSKAIHLIHFSDGLDELECAIRRLKFDEHFFLQLLLALRKSTIKSYGAKRLSDVGPYFRPVSETLDFELSNAQKNVIEEIHKDMKCSYPMNRLLQEM
jgi:RecG-like helicase